jgi:hypothetical protein
MPTVEIASINSKKLGLDQADFDIAIIEENKLESHRGLFYDILQQQDGVIVHLGNPDFKNDKEGGFFAGQIIDWTIDSTEYIELPEYSSDDLGYNSGANQQFTFKFLEQYISEIDKLLKVALDKSPVKNEQQNEVVPKSGTHFCTIMMRNGSSKRDQDPKEL